MFKSLTKIISILLITAMNWSGLAAVCGTRAAFSDLETSTGNTFTAGTLTFSANASAISPIINSATSTATSTLDLFDTGTVPFEYRVSVSSFAGALCALLDLTTDYSGADDSQALQTYIGPTATISGSSQSTLTAQLVSGTNFDDAKGKTCAFTLKINAKQPGAGFDWLTGFNDYKNIAMEVSAVDTAIVPVTVIDLNNPVVVLNEFLPKPIGGADAVMPGGQWVELYNNGGVLANVGGWYLSDGAHNLAIGGSNTNNGGTAIPVHSYLVVYRNGDLSFNINGAITLGLYNASDTLMDSVSYDSSSAPEGKSWARIPDGGSNWVDPVPTPGQPNEITESELKLLPAEQIEQIKEAILDSGAASIIAEPAEGQVQTEEIALATTLDEQINLLGMAPVESGTDTKDSPMAVDPKVEEPAIVEISETPEVVSDVANAAEHIQSETPVVTVAEAPVPAAESALASDAAGSDGGVAVGE